MAHRETVRREFARQSGSFENADLTISSKDHLAWIVDLLPLRPGFRILDVAAGTGHLSRAIAPRVKEVVAIDLTPEMLDRAREESSRAGCDNISFQEGDAGAIQYADATFDMVVSRLAIHHFENPLIQLREMVRVCKPGHTVGVIDLLAPSEPNLSEPYNRLERMRDPSHTRALTKEQLTRAMERAGLVVTRHHTRDVEVDFARWVGMTGVDEPTVRAIEDELEREIAGGDRTGMRPFFVAGALEFRQVWAVLVGQVAEDLHRHPGIRRGGHAV